MMNRLYNQKNQKHLIEESIALRSLQFYITQTGKNKNTLFHKCQRIKKLVSQGTVLFFLSGIYFLFFRPQPIYHMNIFQKYFPSQKHYKIFLLLCLTTLFDFLLVAYRIHFTGFDYGQLASIQDIANTRSSTYIFLIWNLFLAWIPYWISMTLDYLPKKWLAAPLLLVWLVFLPNAPYIVTDLLHVAYHPPVPMWYDTLLLFSFAWTGLLLGFLSIMDVQRFLEKNIKKSISSIIIWTTIFLCAFGVYLGRYQRWNSWDLVTQPYQLFMETMAVILHPFNYAGSLGLAVVMAGILGIGYLTMRILMGRE